MKRLISLVLSLAMILSLSACGSGSSSSSSAGSSAAGSSAASEGSSVYRKLYGSEATTLNYLYSSKTVDMEAAAQGVDTLVEYDKYGNVQPALATEWTTSEDGLTWTFKLRDDAVWVRNDGTEYGPVTAQNFVDALHWVVTPENQSTTSEIVCSVIKNAAEFYAGTVTDINEIGVRAVDDTTLEYTLNAPCPYFLSMLTYVCFMPVQGDFLKEMGDRFATTADTMLYCGAYRLADFQPQVSHTYVKNDKYWDADNVFIEEIQETFNKEALTLAPTMYQRGETDYAVIPADLLPTWMNDPELSQVVGPQRNGYFTYFYAFNFYPRFDEEYEPDNWTLAVNNENFRKSIFYGLDRVKAKAIEEPYDPESQLNNTLTPPNFVSNSEGVDYTQLEPLKAYTNDPTHGFDTTKALEYKEKAVEELTAAGATFPVKILMSYNPSTANWDKQCQIVEQQLEETLGKDYIDIILVAGPATNFLSQVRQAGDYALMLCNWGPDYADPETYTDPFGVGSTYNWPEMATDPSYFTDQVYAEGTPGLDPQYVGQPITVYNQMLDTAKAEKLDIDARYELFAEAEAYFIEHAFVIPFAVRNDGYCVNMVSPFDRPFAPFGVSTLKYKGAKLLGKSMSLEEFQAAETAWETAKEASQS